MTAPGPAGDAAMLYLTDETDRVLMVRARGLLRAHWMPPGGHIDRDESPEDAACRELREELQLACEPGDLVGLGSCQKDVGSGVLTLFTAPRHGGTMRLGDEIAEACWFALDVCHQLSVLPATAYGLRQLTARRHAC